MKRLPLWFLSCCLSFVWVGGGNWPRFRGPDGAGQGEDISVPAVWTESDYVWRVELPGIGQSSPVVWDDQVFVSSSLQEDATRILRSLRVSDGALLWERRFRSIPFDLGRSFSYDTASPTVDEQRVYFTWCSPEGYLVSALDRRTGNEVWRRNLGPFEADHGSGASPTQFEGLLIIPIDQTGPSSIIALDCTTGATQWLLDRRSEKTAYSTPAVFRSSEGPTQLIFASTAHGVSSIDPFTGALAWELPEVFGTIRVVGSPVVANGLVFAQCGSGGGGKKMVAIKPPDDSTGNDAEVLYEIKGSLPYVSTPVAKGDWLFLWSDSGIVSCIDTSTGERLWRERVGGDFLGSPVRAGNRLFCISREGEVVVLAAREQYQLLGRNNLGEPSHSTPALADGVIYLRTFSHLIAIAGQGSKHVSYAAGRTPISTVNETPAIE